MTAGCSSESRARDGADSSSPVWLRDIRGPPSPPPPICFFGDRLVVSTGTVQLGCDGQIKGGNGRSQKPIPCVGLVWATGCSEGNVIVHLVTKRRSLDPVRLQRGSPRQPQRRWRARETGNQSLQQRGPGGQEAGGSQESGQGRGEARGSGRLGFNPAGAAPSSPGAPAKCSRPHPHLPQRGWGAAWFASPFSVTCHSLVVTVILRLGRSSENIVVWERLCSRLLPCGQNGDSGRRHRF